MRPGEELKDGPPIHGNTRLEVFWTAIPTVLLLGAGRLLVRGAARKREEAGARDPDRRHRPAVRVDLPVPAVDDRRAAAEQLPAVRARATSRSSSRSTRRDVIHAFWVPAFRLQEDAVPGITTHWRATPDRLGTYPVVCNLLCGAGHSLMRSTVHVVSQRAVPGVAQRARLRRAAPPAAHAGTGAAAAGRLGGIMWRAEHAAATGNRTTERATR